MYDQVIVTNASDVKIGYLYFRRGRGIECQEFQYDADWLKNGFQIDPELPLVTGIHRARHFEFGCFSDASPDSWGRALIRRYYQKKESRNELYASEYLLAVADTYRMGAFRFYDAHKKLLPNENCSVPATKDLKTFQYLISQIQNGLPILDDDFSDIVNFGSSLGGARPKLSIQDGNQLWIAKFASIHDKYDNPAREAISLCLAKKCGIDVPRFTLFPVNSHQSVLLVARFDRENTLRRPFLSAKSFLLATAGSSNNYSYLDIAAIIEATAIHTARRDLKELWRRMIFNVLIGNKDDHLRNHGFIYKDKGWRLSPVFDLEISPDKMNHSLALDDIGSLTCKLSSLISMSEYYGISSNDAKNSILEMYEIVTSWENVAISELSLTKSSIRKMPKAIDFSDEIRKIQRL